MDAHRRKFLKHVTIGGIVSSFLPVVPSIALPARPPAVERVLRVVHITDVHILDQRNAEASFSRVIDDINKLKEKPDFIINTGDTVMDENKQTRETVAARWKIWEKLTASNKIKVYSALGNHDVWYGPNETLDIEYKKEKRYGKQWAIEMLSMPARYYSFESKGWHFIALDSINGATGYQLDEEQFEWLGATLKNVPADQPVCIFNHVPILSVGATLYLTKRKPAAETQFPSGDMHLDHQRIKNLFFNHSNVKLCLSGHVHYIEAIDYLGVRYLCNGAVSGNWWRENFILDEFPPVYSIIDLFSDGSSRSEIVRYKYEV